MRKKIMLPLCLLCLAVILMQCKKDQKKESQAYNTKIQPRPRDAKTTADLFFSGKPDPTNRFFQKSADGLTYRTVTGIKSDQVTKVYKYQIIEEDINYKLIKKGFLVSQLPLTKGDNLYSFNFNNGEIVYSPKAIPKIGHRKFEIKIKTGGNVDSSYGLGTPTVNYMPVLCNGGGQGPVCIDWYWEEWDAETGQLYTSEYLYTSCYDPCITNGGGGTGGTLGPCADEQLNIEECSYPIGDKISVEICAQNGATRTKCYKWRSFKFSNGIFHLYVVSKEKGDQISTGPNIWEFTSFTHVSNSFEGTSIGYTATLSGEDNIPSIYTYQTNRDMAKMYLMYNVNASGSCGGVPLSYAAPVSNYQTWHAQNN